MVSSGHRMGGLAHRSRRMAVLVLAAAATLGLASTGATSAAAQSTSSTVALKIGALLSITGGGSSLGNTSRAALEVAQGQWNQRLARQHSNVRVVVDVVDTGQDPARATAGFNQLADQGVRIDRLGPSRAPRSPPSSHWPMPVA